MRSAREQSQIKDLLDTSIWEHYDLLSKVEILNSQLDFRFANTLLRLEEEHLKKLKQKRDEGLSEEDLSINRQIHEIFLKREKLALEMRRRQK
jgi:hypothetical protein